MDAWKRQNCQEACSKASKVTFPLVSIRGWRPLIDHRGGSSHSGGLADVVPIMRQIKGPKNHLNFAIPKNKQK